MKYPFLLALVNNCVWNALFMRFYVTRYLIKILLISQFGSVKPRLSSGMNVLIMKYYVVDAQSIVNFASVNHHAVLHLGKHRINFVNLLCQEHRWCYFCPLTTFDISFSAAFAACYMQVSFWLMVSVVDEYVDADITVMCMESNCH